jgi:hypothetical protein
MDLLKMKIRSLTQSPKLQDIKTEDDLGETHILIGGIDEVNAAIAEFKRRYPITEYKTTIISSFPIGPLVFRAEIWRSKINTPPLPPAPIASQLQKAV